MKEQIDIIVENLCCHKINKEEAKKELLELYNGMSKFRAGDNVLIDKDYRTIILKVSDEWITVFDYFNERQFMIEVDRVSLVSKYNPFEIQKSIK